MIKPIMGSSIAKKAILGTMMAGAVVAGSATSKNNNSAVNNQYTEISKEASDASKSMAVTNVMDAQQVGPVRYKALDKKIIATSENQEEVIGNTKFLNDMYNTYGTFCGTAFIQFSLDTNTLCETVKNFKGTIDKKYAKLAKDAEMSKDLSADQKMLLATLGDEHAFSSKEDIEKLAADLHNGTDQILDVFNSENGDLYGKRSIPLFRLANGGVKPTYEQVSKTIDDMFNSIYPNAKDLQEEYQNKVSIFAAKLGPNKTTEKKASIIAYKMYVMDSILMENINGNTKLNKDKDYMKMYKANFLQNCKPE